MKLTNALLVLAVTSGTVWAQNGTNAAQPKQNAQVKAVPVATPVASKPASTAKPAVAQASKAPAAQPVKVNATSAKPSASTAPKSPMTPPAAATQPKTVAAKPAEVKPVAASKPVVVKTAPVVAATSKAAPAKEAKPKAESKPAAAPASKENVSVEKAPEPAKNDKTTKTISANGRRDPFISPVVSQSAVGSGCSTGKRCLAVEQISLKGVVKSETGMIAVVVNAVDKAYFLRENDPVFDGYVLKITGDSIVFKETMQDKLGKSFTKEVTKKLNTPVV